MRTLAINRIRCEQIFVCLSRFAFFSLLNICLLIFSMRKKHLAAMRKTRRIFSNLFETVFNTEAWMYYVVLVFRKVMFFSNNRRNMAKRELEQSIKLIGFLYPHLSTHCQLSLEVVQPNFSFTYNRVFLTNQFDFFGFFDLK